MTGKSIRVAADVIAEVTGKGTYLHLALNGVPDKAVHFLVNGVMEKYFALNYVTDCLCDKIKNNLRPFMIVALYCVIYTDTPLAVVTNVTSEALESAGKGAVKGFFTAVLARADRAEYSLPAPGKKGYDEVRYNLPSWLIGMYKKDYPETYGEIIDNSEKHRTHIVPFCEEREVFSCDPDAEKTETGYFIKNGKGFSELFAEGKITYMSLGSTFVCKAAGDVKGKSVLDSCSAPGGKAVFFASEGAMVTACDLHAHRLKLIESYVKRTRKEIDVVMQDATKRRKEWEGRFDVVLCDVPCSGLGVIDKKRDIVLSRTYDDIVALAGVQKEILSNCAAYVKKGGILLYSTCTVFSKENGEIVDGFLKENGDFRKEFQQQYLPDGKGMEGFFVCRMRKD